MLNEDSSGRKQHPKEKGTLGVYPSSRRNYETPHPWDTHYQFSIKKSMCKQCVCICERERYQRFPFASETIDTKYVHVMFNMNKQCAEQFVLLLQKRAIASREETRRISRRSAAWLTAPRHQRLGDIMWRTKHRKDTVRECGKFTSPSIVPQTHENEFE